MTRIAVIGLGEAGRRYAVDLSRAGAEVRGYDPDPGADDPAVPRVKTLAEAVAAAEVTISLVGTHAAVSVAEQVAPLLNAGALYADFNTAAPEVKRAVEDVAVRTGVHMADVAVLAPVTRAGAGTPLLASGPGAARLAALLRPFNVPIDAIDAPVGAAARLKIVRSVFMKGLATLLIETLTAAEAADAAGWMRGQLTAELGPDAPALVERLITGTHAHRTRREQEVRDALDLLGELGAPDDMTRGTLAWFERLGRESA
ncbi:NAD(P)-binding domain-containing protein [Microbacterium sp. BG28]|uniref:NAD(P)-dependent oxidoreductase n=1 Tax=Microbacterium sp. BG28 TaxID=3097356 RepID=UPI002A59A24F|nr:NAD(P)-binding domain-containing protein [Microbacterium sp. BG28]MDY0829768.1 NAD(P)-binding domain-containing protein [Microbacterium sp. BG28]